MRFLGVDESTEKQELEAEELQGISNTVYIGRIRGTHGCKLHKIELADSECGTKKEKEEGWYITGTMTFASDEVNGKLKRQLNHRVRLPRREKKRRLNNVMRHNQLKEDIIMTNFYSPSTAMLLALSFLYPDMPPKRVDVFGSSAYAISETQEWLVSLLFKRLPKNVKVKIIW